MKKQRSTYRFNLIDVFVILLIIGVIGGVYYFVSGKNSTKIGFGSADKKKVEYVIEIKTLDKDFVDKINVGDKVYETVKHGFIGNVKNVEISPAWAVTTNDITGESFIAEYPIINLPEKPSIPEDPADSAVGDAAEGVTEKETPEETLPEGFVPQYDYYNARITVEAELEYDGSMYCVGSYEIGIGRLIEFRVPHYVGSAYCIALNAVQ